MSLQKAVFLFIKLGLKISEPKDQDVTFMASISDSNWKEVYDVSINQGISAIMLDGINRIFEKGGRNAINNQIPFFWWQRFILEWTGISLNIEAKNRQQENIMREMTNLWASKDCRVVLMKGLANGLYYPNPTHRNPGDIDCYLFDDYEKGNRIALEAGAHLNEEWYKHSEILYKGELFENHRFLIPIRDGKESKELEKELKSELKDKELFNFPDSNCLLPTAQFCAMFLTTHACYHFLFEGLRLKQVLDWAMFLIRENKNVDWDLFFSFCDRYHLRKFADAMNSISFEWLGITVNNSLFVTQSPYTGKIIDSIFYDNDYVYSEEGSNWKKRFHLIRNYFKYRWKFEEIYDQSVWVRLFKDINGFVFHTES